MFLKNALSRVKNLNPAEAAEFMRERSLKQFTLLDVRTREEYQAGRIPGASHIPLDQLVDRLEELDSSVAILTYCASGVRSKSAAQLLEGLGFSSIYNLKGGIKAWEGAQASGPPERGLFVLKGSEEPHELAAAAYGMEAGLGAFYSRMADQTRDEELKKLFRKLAEIEGLHEDMVFGLFLAYAPEAVERSAFEKTVLRGLMEGGLYPDEFVLKYEHLFDTSTRALEGALAVEAQALDLYLRLASKCRNDETRETVLRIADEEKRHMTSLADLLGRRV